MASDSPDTAPERCAPSLEAAVSAVEQRLRSVAPDADPDALASALAGSLEPLARAAKEVLR